MKEVYNIEDLVKNLLEEVECTYKPFPTAKAYKIYVRIYSYSNSNSIADNLGRVYIDFDKKTKKVSIVNHFDYKSNQILQTRLYEVLLKELENVYKKNNKGVNYERT